MNKMNHQGSGSVIDSDAYSGYDRRQLNVTDIAVAAEAYHPIVNTAKFITLAYNYNIYISPDSLRNSLG